MDSVDPAFCIRWPENGQFKRCIIYRFIINTVTSRNSLIKYQAKCELFALVNPR